MHRALSWLLACIGLAGCQPTKQSDRLPIKELIEYYNRSPLGKSIDDVSRGLARCSVWIPTEGVHEPGKPLRMRISIDNQGMEWAYVYTDESELLAAFPEGTSFVEMQFEDLFGIIEKDARFGGIYINHTEKYQYLIPREVFDSVRTVLDSETE